MLWLTRLSKSVPFKNIRVLIERVDFLPTVRKHWGPVSADTSSGYGYTSEYDSIQSETTEVLKMEVREEIDLRRVVKALLWADNDQH